MTALYYTGILPVRVGTQYWSGTGTGTRYQYSFLFILCYLPADFIENKVYFWAKKGLCGKLPLFWP